MPNIGLLNEKPLHASLKQWYAEPGDRFEVPVDGFVVDIVRDPLLVEIQTRNVSAIRAKLSTLARSHPLRLILPITQEKWIVRTNGMGVSQRRKSPRTGRLVDLFAEAVSIPRLVPNSNFSLEALMITEEEARRFEGRRRWRTRGWAVEERRLIQVVDRKLFSSAADWLAFLPAGLESFTTRDLAEAAGTRLDLAQKMAYFLREAGIVESTGRRGRSKLYGAAIA